LKTPNMQFDLCALSIFTTGQLKNNFCKFIKS
jgi:hypothetical protein